MQEADLMSDSDAPSDALPDSPSIKPSVAPKKARKRCFDEVSSGMESANSLEQLQIPYARGHGTQVQCLPEAVEVEEAASKAQTSGKARKLPHGCEGHDRSQLKKPHSKPADAEDERTVGGEMISCDVINGQRVHSSQGGAPTHAGDRTKMRRLRSEGGCPRDLAATGRGEPSSDDDSEEEKNGKFAGKADAAEQRAVVRPGGHQRGGADELEVVPLAASGDGDSTDTDEEFASMDDTAKAEIRAMARKCLGGRKHHLGLLDAAYNRFTFNDEGLPRWFREDEAKHMQPGKSVTRAEIAAEREALQAINARPLRKVCPLLGSAAIGLGLQLTSHRPGRSILSNPPRC
jgi:hypothetical protein